MSAVLGGVVGFFTAPWVTASKESGVLNMLGAFFYPGLVNAITGSYEGGKVGWTRGMTALSDTVYQIKDIEKEKINVPEKDKLQSADHMNDQYSRATGELEALLRHSSRELKNMGDTQGILTFMETDGNKTKKQIQKPPSSPQADFDSEVDPNNNTPTSGRKRS